MLNTIQKTPIDGLYIVQIKEISDERGIIREFFRSSFFTDNKIDTFGPWAQINITETRQGAIRGLHAENMQKLVGVVEGEGFGAYVDVRDNSPSKGMIFTTLLTKGMQVLIPKGVCNGFQSTSTEPSQYLYCFDSEWVAGMPGRSVNPLDPELKIPWPIHVSEADLNLISRKDASAPFLKDVLEA
ncbi:MAG: dTDP-4-dehydrorhamnose 3,5-epimerase [Candidatus Andersenbacteria bacterium]